MALVIAGLTTACGFLVKQARNYKRLLDKNDDEHTIELVEDQLVYPVEEEIQKLRQDMQKEVTILHNEIIDLRTELEETRLALRNSWRFRILQLCKGCIAQQYMTQSQYDSISEMYKGYEALKGNGQVTGYFQRATKLPIYPTDQDAEEAYKKHGTY